jgi:hypothetical protein
MEDCPIGKEMPLQMTGELLAGLLIEAEKKDMFCLLTLNRSGLPTKRSKTMALLPQYGNDLAQAYRLY